ncbi:MAG: type II toxin-antitoxin system RelE/ParE family toxin [Methylococcaceae bacterium]
MPHFKPLRLSDPATADLQAIADYTLTEWGKDQQHLYLNLIKKSFVTLSHVGNIGKPREDIAEGLYSYTTKSHSVYFRELDKGFVVIRILHSRMDVDKNLC